MRWKRARRAARIAAAGGGTALFMLFCAAVQIGVCQAFSLLSVRQTLLLFLLWCAAVRLVWAPFSVSLRRALRGEAAAALDGFAGIGTLFAAWGAELLVSLGRISLLALFAPSAACLILARLALSAGFGGSGTTLFVCGGILSVCGAGIAWNLSRKIGRLRNRRGLAKRGEIVL